MSQAEFCLLDPGGKHKGEHFFFKWRNMFLIPEVRNSLKRMHYHLLAVTIRQWVYSLHDDRHPGEPQHVNSVPIGN